MSFMAEYRRETAAHPIERGWRIWRGVCGVHIGVSGDSVYLIHIMAIPSGRGHGTRCLKWLIDLAAKHGKILYGHAGKFSDRKIDGPGTRKIRAWYRKHGAKLDRKGTFTFTPKGNRNG